MRRSRLPSVAGLTIAALSAALLAQPPAKNGGPYHSAFDVAFSPNGKLLIASDRTAGAAVVIDVAGAKIAKQIAVDQPTGVVWVDDSRAWVSEYGAGNAVEIDPAAGQVLRRIKVGPGPIGLAVAPKRKLLLVANSHTHDVSVVNLADGKTLGTVPVKREPFAIAVSADETVAVVSNLLPLGDATEPNTASVVSFIDLQGLKLLGQAQLPPGSCSARQVAISRDGQWAYVVHTLGRVTLPTTQLERGWVNTNALSVIDLAKREVFATVLMDRLSEGAADPWGLVVSKDGSTLWSTLAGVHQLARIDLASLHNYLAGKLPPDGDPIRKRMPSIWLEVKADPNRRAMLANDLAALYAPGLIQRTNLGCLAPRGMDLSSDGKTLAVASYFSGQVLLVEGQTGKVLSTIALGPPREMDPVRRGEMMFHDATRCFQHWLSCATCHPNTRSDGLNWDLLNDGIGNPKNSRSLVLSYKTAPVMSHGVRASIEVAVSAGFRFIQMHEPTTDELQSVQAYLTALQPENSPYLLPNGELSPQAKKGKALFESSRTGCASCHSGPLLTDLKKYDVGTKGPLDSSGEFVTTKLIELWRSAPYLHHGAAVTLQEVMTKFNKEGRHGTTAQLSKDDIDAIVAYMLSL
jgi:DNA-binding beta-propeller fold protein YncE